MRPSPTVTFSDTHCGDQGDRGVHERFQAAFPSLLELARERGATPRALGDTFDFTGALVTDESIACESQALRQSLLHHLDAGGKPIEIMPGNHDPLQRLGNHLAELLPDGAYRLLPDISVSNGGEMMTHGHFLDISHIVKIIRNIVQNGSENSNTLQIQEILSAIETDTLSQRRLLRRERRHRKADRLLQSLHRKAPSISRKRVRVLDRLVQGGYHPAMRRLHDSISGNSDVMGIRTLLRRRLYSPLTGADLLMHAHQGAWAFLRGHDHVPDVSIRASRDTQGRQGEEYVHANPGSFLSTHHSPTALITDAEKKLATLLSFDERFKKWKPLKSVQHTAAREEEVA